MSNEHANEHTNEFIQPGVELLHADSDVSSKGKTDELFNLNELRLSQDFAAELCVKKALITVSVRKPNGQEFVRVHPEESWRFPTAVLELKEERETYLVHPTLRAELAGEIVPKILFTAVNRQGVVTVWPIRLPGEDGKLDDWNRSALEAAQMAMRKWVRVTSNRSLGAYEVREAMAELPEPEWPDVGFEQLLNIAFKDRYITSLDHPALRRLRGEY